MNIGKIALACGAAATIAGAGVGLGGEAAFASPAPAATSAHSITAASESTPSWRAQETSSAHPETCSNNYWVDASGVRIHKWPLLSAPTVGLAYYGQHVGVLALYSDGWAEISWHGTEEWMRSQYLVNAGLCY